MHWRTLLLAAVAFQFLTWIQQLLTHLMTRMMTFPFSHDFTYGLPPKPETSTACTQQHNHRNQISPLTFDQLNLLFVIQKQSLRSGPFLC